MEISRAQDEDGMLQIASGQPEVRRSKLLAKLKDITELMFYNTPKGDLKIFKSVNFGRLI